MGNLGDLALVPVDQTQHSLQRAARRVVRGWVLAVLALLLITASMLVLAWLTWTYGDTVRLYGVLWLGLAAAGGYNVWRFIPRPADPAPRRDPDAEAESRCPALEVWVSRTCNGWSPVVRLSPLPEIAHGQDELHLGHPLLVCLRESELAALVQDQHALWRADQSAVVRRALRLARGRLGRGWEKKNTSWVTRHLVVAFYQRLDDFFEARAAHLEALRLQRGEDWISAARRVGVLFEAWELLADTWLQPALDRGVWHEDMPTGLRAFVEACEDAGVIENRSEPAGPLVTELFPELAAARPALVRELFAELPLDERPTSWEEHPRTVDEPRWRAALSAGLDAARQATGEPQQASIHSLLTLLENGWGRSIAAVLCSGGAGGAGGGAGPSAAAEGAVLGELLGASISVALLDADAATLSWQWPFGTVLVGPDGGLIDVAELVAEPNLLRSRLRTLGVDPEAPLWLDGGREPEPEKAMAVFAAYQGVSNRRVVVTDRAVRVFPVSQVRATREQLRGWAQGSAALFEDCAKAVERRDFADQVAMVDGDDVVRATLTPLMGGHWWRLRLRTASGRRLSLRGDGSGRHIETYLRPLLGERLRTRWLHAPAALRWVRNAIGYVAIGVLGLGLATAGYAWFAQHDQMSRGDAMVIAGVSLAVFAVALLPEALALLVESLGGATPHDPRSNLLGHTDLA